MTRRKHHAVLTARPYQLLCLACSSGKGSCPAKAGINKIAAKIRKNPDLPLALRCNLDDQFAYQSPGAGADTPASHEFNRKRDMDILLRMDLAPGSILPARVALARMLKAIPSVAGICAYQTVTAPAWKGCQHAASGRYEKNRARGINAIIPPRSKAEMKRDKKASLEDMLRAKTIKIRPHILLCAVAQYGGGVRPPYDPDNLPEMIQHILKKPDTPIQVVRGADWMMCASCPSRVAKLNACVCGGINSGGLYNEMKDLNILQALGLTYGATMKAKDLYRHIFRRIRKTAGICALDYGIAGLSVWRDGCGKNLNPCLGYEKGRAGLIMEMGLNINDNIAV